MEQNQKQLVLLVRPDNGQYGYAHIDCYFTYMDEKKELLFVRDYIFDLGKRSWLQDARIHCQMDNTYSRLPYAERFEFQPHSVTSVDECAAMLATLKKCEKGLRTIFEKYGDYKSFGQYVARVCDVFKIELVCIEADGKRRFHSTGTAVFAIDQLAIETTDKVFGKATEKETAAA